MYIFCKFWFLFVFRESLIEVSNHSLGFSIVIESVF